MKVSPAPDTSSGSVIVPHSLDAIQSPSRDGKHGGEVPTIARLQYEVFLADTKRIPGTETTKHAQEADKHGDHAHVNVASGNGGDAGLTHLHAASRGNITWIDEEHRATRGLASAVQ